MATKGTRNLTIPAKIFMVLACACMTGFMWRARGSHGWGAMWGMFSVGAMLILFIYAFFGNRRKMNYESIPFGIILLGITVGGWGTLNTQMTGYLDSEIPFAGAERLTYVEISPYSGLAIMLLLGFSWMPLFAAFIGSLFSKKEYKVWKYAVLIAVFYVVAIGFQFSVSHYILPKINPQAVENFKLGLADKGISASPMMAYIKNFGNESWGKKIPFGRNYFTSIVVISRAAAALACSLTALIAFRDKITAFVSFGINAVCAIAITAANIPMMSGSDRGFLANRTLPQFFTASAWSMWEFFTGFFIGFGIMLILVCLPKKVLDGEGKYREKSFFKKPSLRFIYGSIFILFFPFGLLFARTLGLRISDYLFEMKKISNEDMVSAIIMVAAGAIALAVCFIIAKKNYIGKGLQIPVCMRCEDFCMKALPLYFAANAVLYFFTGYGSALNLPFAEMKTFASFKVLFFNGSLSVMIVSLAAAVLFFIFFSAAKGLVRVKKNGKN